MGNNTFGSIFTITTWGESHGKAIGVVIDGCPAGLEICEQEINAELFRRAPGMTNYTSPRKEPDRAEILSGVFEGKTTGAPLSILIPNKDQDSSKYEQIKALLRPGHANYTYLEKYGVFDYRGGGRSSARETAGRVAAGAVAKKFLAYHDLYVTAYLKQMGDIAATVDTSHFANLRAATYNSAIFCPDMSAATPMMELIDKLKAEGNSVGGLIEFVTSSLPIGLGDPIYNKLEAKLAHAMLSLPASKAFEIGSGHQATTMYGSEHNDPFIKTSDHISTATNHAGGTLGGISTGMPIIGRVAFKPASSIMQAQETLTTIGDNATFKLPPGSRHDPCVAIRAAPVVEAMVALVLVDAMLSNRCVLL